MFLEKPLSNHNDMEKAALWQAPGTTWRLIKPWSVFRVLFWANQRLQTAGESEACRFRNQTAHSIAWDVSFGFRFLFSCPSAYSIMHCFLHHPHSVSIYPVNDRRRPAIEAFNRFCIDLSQHITFPQSSFPLPVKSARFCPFDRRMPVNCVPACSGAPDSEPHPTKKES